MFKDNNVKYNAWKGRRAAKGQSGIDTAFVIEANESLRKLAFLAWLEPSVQRRIVKLNIMKKKRNLMQQQYSWLPLYPQLMETNETLYGGPGTRDLWPNGPRDQGPLHLGPGPLAGFSLGPGTKGLLSQGPGTTLKICLYLIY